MLSNNRTIASTKKDNCNYEKSIEGRDNHHLEDKLSTLHNDIDDIDDMDVEFYHIFIIL